MTEREQFLTTWEKEYPTTLKVLRAFPAAHANLKPHERARDAKELAWTFAVESTLATLALDDKLELPPKNLPQPPADWNGVVREVDRACRGLADRVRDMQDGDMRGTVRFMTGPKQIGDWRKLDFLWFLLMDMIHHRGQLSVYLRMAGGSVPSIYGPSADEPWM